MARPKQTPSTIGYWALLAPEMKAFCAAWKGTPPASRQLLRFVKDWKKVATWGGSELPNQESQSALIFAVTREYNPVIISQIPIINDRTRIRPAQHALVKHHIDLRRGKQVVSSVIYSQTGCHTGPTKLVQTLPEWLLRVDNLTVIQQAFPDFTSAWLAYAWQLLNNRSDKELVVRVWLHTNAWTQDPDRPGKFRRWTEDGFYHNDIVRCIGRDMETKVSERTVRDVISQMRLDEWDRPPMPRASSQGSTIN